MSREDPRLRAKYGFGDMKNVDDGGPCCNDQFLMARRLVEAGVRCVTLGFGRWDFHGNNFGQCRAYLPKLDQALSALVEDLHARGLDKDVSVVVWGEFGRTPKINKDAGRDHWPRVSCALLAGGGMRTGQVIGSTDRLAEAPKDRPVTFQNVFATLYHNLGIDPATGPPRPSQATPASARGDRADPRARLTAPQPTDPSIWSWMSLFISTAYSIGSSLTSGSMNPLTIRVEASASERPRLIR